MDTKRLQRKSMIYTGVLGFFAILAVTGCSLKVPVSGSNSGTGGSEARMESETVITDPKPHPSDDTEGDHSFELGPKAEIPSTIEAFPGDNESSSSSPSESSFEGCKLLLASDLHYLSEDLTDFGEAFRYKVDHGDGKVVDYIWQITDAWIEEVIREKPDLVIVSGDLSLNGEKKSHERLAEKFRKIEKEGIALIVLPGNHDINNPGAAQFQGEETVPAEWINAEEFSQIYHQFGYDEAVSRDAASLSYVYQIDDYNRALMLDTCQYEPVNRIGGMIREETYDWIEEQMADAWDLGMNVIPVAHHNLLDESEIYVEDCTIEHSEELIDQLNSWEAPLFLSGHLHVQHHMREEEDSGIYEIVTSSLATPPCQYGILYFNHDGSFRYHTQAVDLAAWAGRHELEDENLITFQKYGDIFLSKVFYNQAMDEFGRVEQFQQLSDKQREQMAKVYSTLNSAYYAGKVYEVRDEEKKKAGFQLWEEHGYPSILSQYLESIVRDGTIDYNILESD